MNLINHKATACSPLIYQLTRMKLNVSKDWWYFDTAVLLKSLINLKVNNISSSSCVVYIKVVPRRITKLLHKTSGGWLSIKACLYDQKSCEFLVSKVLLHLELMRTSFNRIHGSKTSVCKNCMVVGRSEEAGWRSSERKWRWNTFSN